MKKHIGHKLFSLVLFAVSSWMAWYVTNSTPKSSFAEGFFGTTAVLFLALTMLVLYIVVISEVVLEHQEKFPPKKEREY